MIMLNTSTGMTKRPVRVKMTATAVLVVGGTNDGDRIDSVHEMFNDHAEELAKSLDDWFKDGMESFTLDDVSVLTAERVGPIRNNEVGTPEEQYARFSAWCETRPADCCKSCGEGATERYAAITCFARWGQMPYVEEGDDDDE